MRADQKRNEYKFVLQPGLGETLRECISKHLSPDPEGPDGYWVSSEYYDTPTHKTYWEKLLSIPSRRRLRSRAYGSLDSELSPSTFLEIKHKCDGQAVKRRLMVPLTDMNAIGRNRIPDPSSHLEEMTFKEMKAMLKDSPYNPVIQIRYWRFAYDDGIDGNLRITFDSQVMCRRPGPPLLAASPAFDLPLIEKGAEVMEVKTIGPVPYWMRKMVGKHNLIPRGFSKYTTALQTHPPESLKKDTAARHSTQAKPVPA